MPTKVSHCAEQEEFANRNDLVIVTAGISFHIVGEINNIRMIQF